MAEIKLKLNTDPTYINFDTFEKGVFNYLLIRDSIFDFYPIFQFEVPDISSIWSENFIFIEGLKFDLELSDARENKLKNSYFWSESDIPKPAAKDILAGMTVNNLLSYNKLKDSQKSKSYLNNISNIVRILYSKYSSSLNISQSANTDYWYQANLEDSAFIKLLSKYSYSVTYPKSPFVTFINANNEFYFRTIKELCSQKEIVTGKFGQPESEFLGAIEDSVISDYNLKNLGAPNNMWNYDKVIYGVDKSGDHSSIDRSIKDLKNIKNNLLIESKTLDNQTRYKYYGVIDSNFSYRGFCNSELSDSMFPYRISVDLNDLDLRLVAGKTFSTSFTSPNSRNDKSKEYSDKWLILSSTHIVTDTNAKTQLLLGRDSVPVNISNKLKNSLV